MSAERSGKSPEAVIADLLATVRLAYSAMNYMGDILNGMDCVADEDIAAVEPAFKAVRAALAETQRSSHANESDEKEQP